MDDYFASYPETIRQSSKGDAAFFHRAADLFAVRGPVPAAVQSNIVAIIEEGNITVCRGAPQDWADNAEITPVYRLEGGASPAVPTGLIFVRFTEEVSSADRTQDLAQTGYRIDRIPPYAPHTAWVFSADGNAARGLRAIETLMLLPGMVHVEPQLLMPKVTRLERGQ